jgi:hypothetical protein
MNWTENNTEYLVENYKFGSRFVSEKLGCKISSVQFKAFRLGLKLSKEDKSKICIKSFEKRDRNRRIPEIKFLNIIDPEVAYFLGFFWADGSITASNYSIALGLNKEDMEDIKWIFDKIGNWGVSEYNDPRSTISKKIVCSSKPLHSFFVEMDFLKKSTVSPFKILSKIPDNLKYLWWRGYFDGDGHCSNIRSGSYHAGFCGSFDQDWSFVEDLFKNLNIKASLYKKNLESGKSSYYAINNKKSVFSLFDYLYPDNDFINFKLNRKYNAFIWLKNQSFNNTKDKASTKRGISLLKTQTKLKKGIINRNGRFRVLIANLNIGTFDSEVAAINAYNYFASIRYGKYFIPSQVEIFMDKNAFMLEISKREKRKISHEQIENIFKNYCILMKYDY